MSVEIKYFGNTRFKPFAARVDSLKELAKLPPFNKSNPFDDGVSKNYIPPSHRQIDGLGWEESGHKGGPDMFAAWDSGGNPCVLPKSELIKIAADAGSSAGSTAGSSAGSTAGATAGANAGAEAGANAGAVAGAEAGAASADAMAPALNALANALISGDLAALMEAVNWDNERGNWTVGISTEGYYTYVGFDDNLSTRRFSLTFNGQAHTCNVSTSYPSGTSTLANYVLGQMSGALGSGEYTEASVGVAKDYVMNAPWYRRM
jgi:hypothetical protein